MNKDFWESSKPDWILTLTAAALTIFMFIYLMTGRFE